MINFRRKVFADVPTPGEMLQDIGQNTNPNNQGNTSSKDLLVQQMRLQRQIILTQQARQKLQQQERLARIRQTNTEQRIEQQKEETQSRNQLKAKKLEQDSNSISNTSLYKTRSHAVQPVPMKV